MELTYRILATLILTTFLPANKALIFTKVPSKYRKLLRRSSIWLLWKYKLENGEKVIRHEFHFKNSTYGNHFIIAKNSGTTSISKFPKVKPFAKTAILISDIDYPEAGIYCFKVITDTATYSSKYTLIEVEGEPVFCDEPKDAIKVNEKEPKSIAVCALTKPDVFFRWKDIGPTKTRVSVDKRYYSRYTADLYLASDLDRERCGRTLSYYAQNKFGRTLTQEKKIDVWFKPDPAKNTKTYFGGVCGLEVIWEKQESGLCKINYEVYFLNSSQQVVTSKTVKSKLAAFALIPLFNNITLIILKAYNERYSTFKAIYLNRTYAPMPPKKREERRDDSPWVIYGSVVGTVLLIIFLALLVLYIKWKLLWRKVAITRCNVATQSKLITQ